MKINSIGAQANSFCKWFVFLSLLSFTVVHAQRVDVQYTILATSERPECESGIYPGQTGTLTVSPGFPQSVRIRINEVTNCDNYLPCFYFPLLSVSASPPACFGVNFWDFPIEHLWSGNVLLGTCDSELPFYLSASASEYKGSIKIEACGNSLPSDGVSTASVSYEPPVAPYVPFQSPISWSCSSAYGAHLINIGPTTAQLVAGTNAEMVTIRATCTNTCTNCFVETTFDIKDAIGSSCTGTCSSNEREQFGEGSVELDGVKFKLHLGQALHERSAGLLSLQLSAPGSNAYSARSLKYDFRPPGVEIIPPSYSPSNPSHSISQIKTPQGLLVITNVTGGYLVRLYTLTNVWNWSAGGIMYNTNFPMTEWRVTNPDAGIGETNRIRITEVKEGRSRVWTYEWIPLPWESGSTHGWSLTKPDGTQQIQDLGDPELAIWSHSLRTFDSSSSLVQYTEEKKTLINGRRYITEKRHGLDEALRVEQFDYYTNGLLKQMVREDGYWEYHVYDALGRRTHLYSAFGNQGVTTNTNLCRLVESSYDASVVSSSGDTNGFSAATPRRMVESLLGQEVSRRYQVFLPGETRDIRCVTPNAEWDDPGNLVTITKSHTSGFFYGYPRSVLHPDGTVDVLEYTWGAGVTNQTNTVWSGIPGDSYHTNVIDGTKLVTVIGPLGQLISTTTTDIASTNKVIARKLYGEFDLYWQPRAVTNLDGTWEFSQRFCCGDTVTTNREGTVITKTYDAMNRLLTTTANGITHSNTYDAVGNILRVERIGSELTNAAIVLQRNAYDTAGHLVASTNALNRMRLTSEANDGSGYRFLTNLINVNSSIFASQIDTYFRDGTLAQRTGSRVRPARFEYGVYSTNGGGTFTKEIKLDASGDATDEWNIQFYDLLGRPCRILYADGASSHTVYNTVGQISKQVDPDGVTTLYQYNARGERAYTVLDLDRDDTIDWNTDRITWNTNYVRNNSVADVHRSETYVWGTNGSAVPTLVSVQESAVNGLASWSTNNGLSSRTEITFSGGGLRYNRSFAPDGAIITTRFEHGRIIASGRTNSGICLGATSFGYDEHGRQKYLIDARNGTNTTTFNDLDETVSTTTPVPDLVHSAQTTSYGRNGLGQAVSITYPDGGSVDKEYSHLGEVTKTTGAREYPVEYTYDAQGRMATMKTWRSYPNESTAAVTTWNYHSSRGWLQSKNYVDTTTGEPDGPGSGYTYTAAGRLRQRTWARSTTTIYTNNSLGQVERIAYSDSTGNVTNTYDRPGRVTKVQSGTNVTTRLYSEAGVLLSETQNGIVVSNRYDSLLRRTDVAVVIDGTVVGSTSYGYDTAGRLSTVSHGTNNATYSYIANSPLIGQITFTNGMSLRMTTSKSYDYLNRLTLITNHVPAAGTESPAFAYVLNPANQRTNITHSDGSRWSFGYDVIGQVTNGVKRWSDGSPVLGQQFAYLFDDIGNRKMAISGGDSNGLHLRLQTYSANALNQYTSRTVPGYVDILGTATNAATVTVNGVRASRRNDYYRAEVGVPNSGPVWQTISNCAVLASGSDDYVTNWMGNVFVPATPESFTYDLDGNLTSDGRWVNTWDGENRLLSQTSHSSGPSGSRYDIRHGYDSQSRRISKVVSNWTGSAWAKLYEQRFVYDGWNLIAILDENNAVQVSFAWGSDLSGSMQGAGGVGGLVSMTIHSGAWAGTYCYAFDGNGNVVALISTYDGSVVARYEYDPFHRLLRATGPLAFTNPFVASTKFCDSESGLLYYGHRYYSMQLGNWWSRDALEESTGANLYGFCYNNTISSADVDGRQIFTQNQINKPIAKPKPPSVFYDLVNDYYIFEMNLKPGDTVNHQNTGLMTIQSGDLRPISEDSKLGKLKCLLGKLGFTLPTLKFPVYLATFNNSGYAWNVSYGVPDKRPTFFDVSSINGLHNGNAELQVVTMWHELVGHGVYAGDHPPEGSAEFDAKYEVPIQNAINAAKARMRDLKGNRCATCNNGNRAWQLANEFDLFMCECGIAAPNNSGK